MLFINKSSIEFYYLSYFSTTWPYLVFFMLNLEISFCHIKIRYFSLVMFIRISNIKWRTRNCSIFTVWKTRWSRRYTIFQLYVCVFLSFFSLSSFTLLRYDRLVFFWTLLGKYLFKTYSKLKLNDQTSIPILIFSFSILLQTLFIYWFEFMITEESICGGWY